MIYFVQRPEGGPIKIGTSENVYARHRQLEIHYGHALSILAITDGDQEEEASLHHRFRSLRIGVTEQFQPGPELLEYIHSIKGDRRTDHEPMRPDPGSHAVKSHRRKSQGRDTASVKLDRRLAEMAKFVATYRGVSVSELIDDLSRDPIDRVYCQVARELSEGLKTGAERLHAEATGKQQKKG